LDVAGGEWARASHIGLDLGVMWSDDYANPGDLTRYEYAAVHLVYGSSF
jgi:hypothetical protein